MRLRTAFVLSLFLLAVPAIFAQHSAQGILLVAQKGARSLAIIDLNSGKVAASVPEGGITGHEVAASPDGHFAYVPIYGNSGVGSPGTDGRNMVVIDIAAEKVVNSVDFGHGVRPHLPVIGPKDGLLYVTTELDNAVTIIDPKTLKIVGKIPTGEAQSHMLALSSDGLRGYTANVGPGTVSVLDIKARKTLAVIPVARQVQRISISPDNKWIFTSDQTQPRLAVIDTATNKVATWIPLAATGYGSAPTPNGRWLLIALPDANKVAVVDLQTMKVARNIDVPAAPQEIVVRPDGKLAYVSCEGSDQVAEIDLAAWKITRTFHTGKGTDGLAWTKSD